MREINMKDVNQRQPKPKAFDLGQTYTECGWYYSLKKK